MRTDVMKKHTAVATNRAVLTWMAPCSTCRRRPRRAPAQGSQTAEKHLGGSLKRLKLFVVDRVSVRVARVHQTSRNLLVTTGAIDAMGLAPVTSRSCRLASAACFVLGTGAAMC